MKTMNTHIIWAISLLLIGIVILLLTVPPLVGIQLPDAAVRILGLTDFILLPVLAFTTVKKLKNRT